MGPACAGTTMERAGTTKPPPFHRPVLSPIFGLMAKSPDDPKKPKKPKDYAKPTRAKAHRPDAPAHDPHLDDLLNPGIARGPAGMGSGTGLQPPPDNSFDRRADRAAEQRARVLRQVRVQGTSAIRLRRPHAVRRSASPITGLDPALARELGLE